MNIRITPRVKVGLIVGLVFVVALSYVIHNFTNRPIVQKENQISSGHESVDEYNKRKIEEALKEAHRNKKSRQSTEKIDLNYGKELTIDGWDPASQTVIDPINLWTSYENRTYAGKVRHGEKVWYVKREGDGVLVETKSGKRGWVTYFFIKEFRTEKNK
jgi:hypothetical protein